MATQASPELRAFIYEGIRRGATKGYHPTLFIQMLDTYEMKRAISKLVTSGDMQSWFRRLVALGLIDWTVEAAVERFSTEFSENDIECARFRLSLARQEG